MINYKQLIAIIVTWIISLTLLCWIFALSSCSAKFHYKKFLQKGGKEIVHSDTFQVISVDTFVVNGDTIYKFHKKDTIIEYKNIYVPKTRYETRIEYKRFRDTLRLIEYKTKIEYKTNVKTIKNDKKRGVWYNFRFIGVITFLLTLIILLFKFKK